MSVIHVDDDGREISMLLTRAEVRDAIPSGIGDHPHGPAVGDAFHINFKGRGYEYFVYRVVNRRDWWLVYGTLDFALTTDPKPSPWRRLRLVKA